MKLFNNKRIERYADIAILLSLIAMGLHPYWYMLIPMAIALVVKYAMVWVRG